MEDVRYPFFRFESINFVAVSRRAAVVRNLCIPSLSEVVDSSIPMKRGMWLSGSCGSGTWCCNSCSRIGVADCGVRPANTEELQLKTVIIFVF